MKIDDALEEIKSLETVPYKEIQQMIKQPEQQGFAKSQFEGNTKKLGTFATDKVDLDEN